MFDMTAMTGRTVLPDAAKGNLVCFWVIPGMEYTNLDGEGFNIRFIQPQPVGYRQNFMSANLCQMLRCRFFRKL